jgi:hypothetical protein
MAAETMYVPRPRSDQPNLRIGKARTQPITRSQFVVIHFILTCVDIDGNELVFIFRLQMWADSASVDVVATLRELLLAIPALC